MKNLKKWLALLLAGLLTLTSLAACGGADEEENEDEEESSEVGYRNLTPEKAYNALLEADDVRVTVNEFFKYDHEDSESTTVKITDRDGNKVKEKRSDSDGYENTEYYDLTNGRYYNDNDDGEWSVSVRWGNRWSGIVEYAFFPVTDFYADFLIDDDSYQKDGDRYVVTAEAINEYITEMEEIAGEHIDAQIEAYMYQEDNKYTYVLNTDELEPKEVNNWEITVEFTDVTVEFPDFGIEIEQDDDGFVYELKDSGTYTVVNIGGTDKTDLVIPSVYKGRAVTEIGDGAFRGAGITSITIPDSVTSIGEDAFYYCDSLTSLTIPDSVTRIGWNAFKRCTSLTSVTFENPDGWTVDGEPIDLSDPAQAAKYLTDTYADNLFERS